jgi:hypothetical protein
MTFNFEERDELTKALTARLNYCDSSAREHATLAKKCKPQFRKRHATIAEDRRQSAGRCRELLNRVNAEWLV